MKAKEFGARPPWNEGSGGQHNSFDEYNRALKGHEMNTVAQEYTSAGILEYLRIAETKDITSEQFWKRPGMDSSRDRLQSSMSGKSGMSGKSNLAQNVQKLTGNVLKQVVGIVVGSAVIVSSYQAQVDARDNKPLPTEPPAITEVEPGFEDEGTDVTQIVPQDEQTPPETEQNIPETDDNTPGDDQNTPGDGQTPQGAQVVPQNEQTPPEDEETPPEDEEVPPEDEELSPEEEETPPEEEQNEDGDDQGEEGDEQPESGDSASSGESDSGSTVSNVQFSWSINTAGSSATAVITNIYGVKEEVPAQVTVTEETYCTESGTRTYTATATDQYGNEYIDVQTEAIDPLGHSFVKDDSQSTDGKIVYHCDTCNEDLVITYVVTPE